LRQRDETVLNIIGIIEGGVALFKKLKEFLKYFVEIIKSPVKGLDDLAALLQKGVTKVDDFAKNVKELPKNISSKGKKIKEALAARSEKIKKGVDKKNGMRTTIGGTPMNKGLLNKIKESWKRLGKEIRQGDTETQTWLDYRKAEGLTFDDKLILLDKNASTSAVYEELIHATQHRTGKYGKIVEEYGNTIGETMLEIEAAEKLLKNSRAWKIPADEIKQIEERLSIFKNNLKELL
jgi:hypothetical protein